MSLGCSSCSCAGTLPVLQRARNNPRGYEEPPGGALEDRVGGQPGRPFKLRAHTQRTAPLASACKACLLMGPGVGAPLPVGPCAPAAHHLIRAKAVSEKEVDSGNDIYGNPIKRIQYEIKQIKMFKGPDKDIEFIYTAPSSAVCGVSLDVGGKKEYLIAGKAEGDGRMHITLCDFIVPWDSLSSTQKKSLNHRYQMGCECKISRCPMIPCYISSPDECLWMDWVTEKNINGHQAKFFACIKRSDGSCAWYRGAAPPKQEFLDIEDP
uniref:Metalloproteinase inhibitor 2 n=1 Tax=Oryctolagus cuniculus TaxID=9986 RepID=A0A5F9DFE9_RABIT